MACGAPVLTGRTPALAEVGGGAIEHVDEIEPDALGQALVTLAASRDRREELVGQRPRAVRDLLLGPRRAREPRDLPADGAKPRSARRCRGRVGGVARAPAPDRR